MQQSYSNTNTTRLSKQVIPCTCTCMTEKLSISPLTSQVAWQKATQGKISAKMLSALCMCLQSECLLIFMTTMFVPQPHSFDQSCMHPSCLGLKTMHKIFSIKSYTPPPPTHTYTHVHVCAYMQYGSSGSSYCWKEEYRTCCMYVQ